MDGTALNTGELLAATAAAIRENLSTALLCVALLAAGGTISDMISTRPGAGLALPLAFAALFAQSRVTQDQLTRRGLMPDGYSGARVWALLGIGFLVNMGTVLGLVLLIVPGVFLAVRWSLAVPALFSREAGVIEAIGISWDETKGNFWPILCVLAVIYAPMIVGMFLIGFLATGNEAFDGVPANMLMNTILYASMIAGWHAAVEIYAAIRPGSGHLSEIFA